MADKKKVPSLRFGEYSDEWEQRKLGDLGTIQTCKRVFKEQTSEHGEIPFYKNGTIGLKADAFISRSLFEEYRRLYPYPEIGDILISAVGSVGRTAEYTGEDEYFQDSNVVWLKTDSSVEKKYLKVFYQVIDWLIEGSTVKHLYNDNILRSVILMPTEKIEQRKIGMFFEEIDNLITLHQRKLDKLRIIKQSMLFRMFPRDGSCFPEVRFAGFTEPWEQRKFSELFTERRDKTTKEDEDVLLSCAITGMYLNSELFGHQRGRSNIGYLKIKMNDLILSAQNLHLGNANVNKRFEHGIISPAYKVYEINDCNPDFIQAWVKQESTKKFFLDVTTEGASQCRKNIDWNMLANSAIPVPSPSEQNQIGAFVSCLDNTITLHQCKQEKLKHIKTALLQKMFVC